MKPFSKRSVFPSERVNLSHFWDLPDVARRQPYVLIAGLETPDSGQVFLDGKDVTDLAPEARDVNTVFLELRPVSVI